MHFEVASFIKLKDIKYPSKLINNFRVNMEEKVGISVFLTSGPKFSGVIKHIPQDFKVIELDTTGQPVQLTPAPELPPQHARNVP